MQQQQQQQGGVAGGGRRAESCVSCGIFRDAHMQQQQQLPPISFALPGFAHTQSLSVSLCRHRKTCVIKSVSVCMCVCLQLVFAEGVFKQQLQYLKDTY